MLPTGRLSEIRLLINIYAILLHHPDCDSSFAGLGLRGLRYYGGYVVLVQQFVRRDDQVDAYVEFPSLKPT